MFCSCSECVLPCARKHSAFKAAKVSLQGCGWLDPSADEQLSASVKFRSVAIYVEASLGVASVQEGPTGRRGVRGTYQESAGPVHGDLK